MASVGARLGQRSTHLRPFRRALDRRGYPAQGSMVGSNITQIVTDGGGDARVFARTHCIRRSFDAHEFEVAPRRQAG